MYESYFGLSGTPFNLNPDPNFYFDSRGHSHALSYLKFGVYQGEGFVVVTGEIGAGKTTLVRTLLAGLNPEEIVAAQIVSTQLDAGDLLRSVALAFGIAPKNLSKAELIATIEAFLTDLVIQKKRALLVVDEAQNLDLPAIEELRMLSNFQLGNHALLQSFLIGQPELRALLTSRPMEQLRQRVIASCHLGPMERRETEAYIRHRLARVGWTDRPTFDDQAFDEIYAATGGVPRRVNLLCNRLLLATYLRGAMHVDAACVREVAQEVLTEVGEVPRTSAAARLVAPAVVEPADGSGGTMRAGELLLVSGSLSDDIKLATLMHALKGRKGLPALTLVRIGDATVHSLGDSVFRRLGLEAPPPPLAASGATPSSRMAHAMLAFEHIVDGSMPAAVMLAGTGDVALGVALVCRKRKLPVMHADSGRRNGLEDAGSNAPLLETLVDLHYAPDAAAVEALVRAGVARARVLKVGELIAEAALLCREPARLPQDVVAGSPAAEALVAAKRGFGWVAVGASIPDADSDDLAGMLSVIRQVSADLPLLWPLHQVAADRIRAAGLGNLVDDPRIVRIDPVAFPDAVAMLAAAALVLTDSRHVQAQAAALRVACLRVDRYRQEGSPNDGGVTLPDIKKIGTGSFRIPTATHDVSGRPAESLAEHLAEWLRSRALVAQLARS